MFIKREMSIYIISTVHTVPGYVGPLNIQHDVYAEYYELYNVIYNFANTSHIWPRQVHGSFINRVTSWNNMCNANTWLG